MADLLVVGLAKSVVESALSKAQSALEGAMVRQSAQPDLVSIACEFEMISSFLHVTAGERVENNLMKTWVRHVRELAHDMEDLIEFVVHLDTKTVWWVRMVPSCMAPPVALDEATGEIMGIKARVEDLSKAYMRYRHIRDSDSKPLTQHEPRASSMLTGASDATRRLQGLGDLAHLITNKDNEDPRLQVISVWGTGGELGTTSIVRKAYRDPEITQNFACRSWVKLMHPFNPREFVRRFMAQVYTNACQEEGADVGVYVLTKMEAGEQDLLKEFVEEVNTKTYLVVLEDLTDMVDWDAVRTFLPDMKKHSWIIVSTQQFEIASLCIGHSCHQMELKQFSSDHSVFAFFKQGSQSYRDKDEKLPLSDVRRNPSYENIPSHNREEEARHWINNYPLVGRETEMNELRSYTAKARFSNSQVISVWGIAGIGKSALVRSLYYDRVLRSNQFNEYRWVDISHPFSLQDFYGSLLLGHHSEKDHIMKCRELLSQRQCLVIIDDLRSKEEWDLIQAALVSTRSYASIIIVITAEANVATYCANNEELVFNVKSLEAAAAMDLFRNEVRRKETPFTLDHRDFDVNELILRCGGLPKVIVALAALLATQTGTLMDSVHHLNRRFIDQLENNPGFNSLRALFSWMHAHFRELPDSLKPCIFYLSIFPRDRNIRRRRLVRRWIAEGYSRDSDKKSAEQQGEEFFSKLLELSIIQHIPELVSTATGDTRMVKCQVNGFFHEYIVSRVKQEDFVFELGPNCDLPTQRTGHHLIILRGWERDIIVFESIDFSRLRSMTVYGKWESYFISISMRLLRVLDLEDADGVRDEDLECILYRLRRLKFLSIRGCIEISHLPSSVGDLNQLQVLDVRHTSIVTLPQNITRLKKLRYVRAGTTLSASTPSVSNCWPKKFCKSRQLGGVQVPSGISKLTELHTLGVVNISASGGKAIVKEIKELTQLRKLGASGINRQNSKEFFSAISGHAHLESLLVHLEKGNQGCLEDISLPWVNLQSLKLYGLHDRLPQLSGQLNNLRKLNLDMATLSHRDMEFLAKLPKLCILRLQLQDDKLHFFAEINGYELHTFEKMKILEISCSSSMVFEVIFGSKSMENLELLRFDCSRASYRLTGLSHLCELKQVLLKGTTDEAVKTGLETQLAEHPRRPVVKLEELPRYW